MIRIGILVGTKWACFKWDEEWIVKGLTKGKRNIAWAETVTIRLGLLVLAKLTTVRGRVFWVDTCWVVTSSRDEFHQEITWQTGYQGVS